MLNSLTQEQKALKAQVKKEWIDRLTESTDIDLKALKAGISFCYAKLKNKNPKIYICNNPISAIKLCRKLGNKDIKTFHYYGLGYDSGWLAFYDYFQRIGVVKSEKFSKYLAFQKAGVFAFIFFENAVICIRRPVYIKRDAKQKLHCATGPAIEFLGGWKSYRLHGVKVPEKVVLAPEKLTKEEILGEKNVDVRREMVRQIGLERFCFLANPKVLDKQGDYELLSIDLSDTLKDCRYLKMKNPSISVWHIEGVDGKCDTVQQAINWRAGDISKTWTPVKLS